MYDKTTMYEKYIRKKKIIAPSTTIRPEAIIKKYINLYSLVYSTRKLIMSFDVPIKF